MQLEILILINRMMDNMSQRYYINFQLNLNYNLSNIKEIIEKGSSLGFIYLQPSFVEFDPSRLQKLTTSEAVETIYKGRMVDDDIINFVKVNQNETCFHFHITNEGTMMISIGFIFPAILKTFNNNIEDVDIAYYARILFELAPGCRILSFVIAKR